MASPMWHPALILVAVSVHVYLCVCMSSSLCVYLCFACVLQRVQTKPDVINHSQIYNSGSQRGMNTLVSVADDGDEQRVIWLLSILPGNHSAIYNQREGVRESRRQREKVSYLVWGCKSGFWREWTRSERDRDRSLYPSLPWVLCDLITVVLFDILPRPFSPHSFLCCIFLNPHMTTQYDADATQHKQTNFCFLKHSCIHLAFPCLVSFCLSEASLLITAEI